jgi:hypothetical protein
MPYLGGAADMLEPGSNTSHSSSNRVWKYHLSLVRVLPCLLVYIFANCIFQILANGANASPVAGYRWHPPRCFVSPSSAAPTAPLGSAFLASPGTMHFTSTCLVANLLAYTLSVDQPGVLNMASVINRFPGARRFRAVRMRLT